MKKINAILSLIMTMTLVVSAVAQTGSAKLTAGVGAATAEAGVAAAPVETLIKNATILTASHGTINNGSILIRDGKIAEVGPNVKGGDGNARGVIATGR